MVNVLDYSQTEAMCLKTLFYHLDNSNIYENSSF